MDFVVEWAKILFLDLDKHLDFLVDNYGLWIYVILFLIIFCETGLVVTPFLPGDSLLFAVGALAGTGKLDIWILLVLLSIAAILGDTLNYWIGNKVGTKIFCKSTGWLLNKNHLDQTHRFYEKHGGKTIILARFMPVIRTFAPFVAGIGAMSYRKFLFYNVVGAILWMITLVGAGYFLGSLPFIKNNFSKVILVIIVVSMLPGIWEVLKARFSKEKN